jgi:hypothetical protein
LGTGFTWGPGSLGDRGIVVVGNFDVGCLRIAFVQDHPVVQREGFALLQRQRAGIAVHPFEIV